MTLPDAKILETSVKPAGDNSIVRIQISDGPLEPPAYSTLLQISVEIPVAPKTLLAQIEHDAIDFANSILAALVRQKKDELGLSHR